MSGLPPDELAALIAKLRTPAIAALVCTVCGDPLDQVHADLGTHPICDPEPEAAQVPPSTIGELHNALIDYEQARPRSTQTTIGPSQIAVRCDRQLGYMLHSTPARSDGRVKWAPMLGTAVHAMLALALEAENERLGRERWLVERRVHPDPMIVGSCDAYDTDHDVVIDWKVVGQSTLDKVRPGPRTPDRKPSDQYVGQIQMYGRGWQRAGRNPRWVRIVFLPRSHEFDDAYEWTAPYSRVTADACLDRMYRVSNLLTDLNVADTPNLWAAVPATFGDECRYCPFLRQGGAADGTGCPGDPNAVATAEARFAEGLIL